MILVSLLTEFLEEYTVLLARVLEHLFHQAPLPFPRRVRFLILRNLPFASPPSSPSVYWITGSINYVILSLSPIFYVLIKALDTISHLVVDEAFDYKTSFVIPGVIRLGKN
ncbi:unnamed protein product [Fraxinus pennsylvanica]|uniref:Uncharacterized protein n=1 Tax=Fraxinus pennsylvanica TaxID=56036 RepID=A0AAD2E1L8_9LAMI|nr:unnamed protein product [Fraxinus pennsylvanica]